jgi:FkbM family methyltransferase
MNNALGFATLNYIWSHPNCQKTQIQSIFKFITWQFYKRVTRRAIDIQIIPDVKMRCYPDSRSASAALYCGLYDYNDMNFLLRYLRPEDSFLDIGANVGIYTLLAASKIVSGKIYSFEALPKNYKRLHENLALNHFDQVQPFSVAVSDRRGEIALGLAEGDSMPFINLNTTSNTITVPTATLDDLLKDAPVNTLTLGKIDIEGAELLAFKGAQALFANQCPQVWILEILDATEQFGYGKQDLVDWLKIHGYGLYAYNAVTHQLSPITLDQQDGNNVLAIADSALQFVRDRLA